MITSIIQKTILRLWIVTASIVSFVAGWAMLAQTPHPSQDNTAASQPSRSSPAQVFVPVPTLDPSMLQLGVPPSASPFVMPSIPQRGLIFSTGGS